MLRVVVLGYHNVGCACLDVLVRSGVDVAAVYTHRDDPAEQIWFDSIAQRATRLGIPVRYPERINQRRWIDQIELDAPDLIFSFYYRRLVCKEILDIPRLGGMNMHGSYLPAYRGRCPVNWALLHGETETGVTLHQMVEESDAGPIVAQRRIAIDFSDTALTLHRKIAAHAASLLEQTLPAIRQGTHDRVPQDLSAGSKFERRCPADGRIDWARPAVEILNLIRAVTHPFPGAFTWLDETPLFIWEALPVDRQQHAPGVPGRVVLDDGFLIETGSGQLRVLRCQLAGEQETGPEELMAHSLLRPGNVLHDKHQDQRESTHTGC